MRKTSKSGSDSLEMFLDTICNTFGGILFILLFIVVQLQMAQKSVSEAVGNPVSAIEFDTLKAQWESKSYDLEKLRKQIEQFEILTKNLADNDAQEKFIQWQNLLKANQELLDQIAAKTQQVSENDAEAARISALNQRLLKEIEELQTQIANAEADMPDTTDTADQTPEKLTCPQLKKTYKIAVNLFLVFNRLYVLYNYTNNGTPINLNTEDFVVIGKSDKETQLFPNPLRGIDLTADDADDKIGALVKPFSPDAYHMAVVTAIDSFEQYHFVRDALKKRGFEIRPLTLSLDSGISTGENVRSEVQ